MSRNRLIDDILDLCDEQGFRHELLMAKSGVRVFPKTPDKHPVTLYFASSGNGHEADNQKAMMRRIGLRFPIDDERERRKTKAEKINMVEPLKMNGTGQAKAPEIGVGIDEIIDRIINRNAALFDALAQTDEDLKKLRVLMKNQSQSRADAVKELLRQAML